MLTRAWALWFVAFFWVWMFLVGDWNRIEWIAGGLIAAAAATIAESVRRFARVELLVPLDILRASATAIGMVFVDFGILTFALIRSLVTGRVVRGEYIIRPIDPGTKTTAAGVARRAWTVLVAGYSPNAYVVDIDVEGEQVVVHDLIRHRQSERPA